jgi:hypothetical protein
MIFGFESSILDEYFAVFMCVSNTNRLCQPAEINHFDDYGVFARHSAGNRSRV